MREFGPEKNDRASCAKRSSHGPHNGSDVGFDAGFRSRARLVARLSGPCVICVAISQTPGRPGRGHRGRRARRFSRRCAQARRLRGAIELEDLDLRHLPAHRRRLPGPRISPPRSCRGGAPGARPAECVARAGARAGRQASAESAARAARRSQPGTARGVRALRGRGADHARGGRGARLSAADRLLSLARGSPQPARCAERGAGATMTPGRDPERWVVSAEAPPELRALLEVARREGPSLAQKVTLGSRLGLSMQQALLGLGAKGVAVGTIALAGVVGAGLGIYTGQDGVAAATVPPAPAPMSAPATPAPADAADAPPTLTGTSETKAPASAPPAKPPSEAFLIRSAKSALPHSTRQARAYLERHQRLYPSGQLAQEREVLLIEVLRSEGRVADANTRAQQFEQKNPDSPHRPIKQ